MNFIAPLFPRGLLFEIKRERRVRPLNYSSKRKGKVKRGYAIKYTPIVAFAPSFITSYAKIVGVALFHAMVKLNYETVCLRNIL